MPARPSGRCSADARRARRIQAPGPDPDKLPESGYIPNGQLRAQGMRFAAQNPDNEDEIRPGYEPKRRYLTDPPTGYRSRAAFKKQYGAPIKKESEKEHPLDFAGRAG